MEREVAAGRDAVMPDLISRPAFIAGLRKKRDASMCWHDGMKSRLSIPCPIQ